MRDFFTMQIVLDHIYPSFLDKYLVEHSEVWTKKVVIQKGERLQIVAPSGSGKTSLINFLYGLRSDYEGNIFFDGKNIRQFSPEDWARLRSSQVSIMFQDLRLFPTQTAAENIEIKRALKPYHNTDEAGLMSQMLGIAPKLNQQAEICSYGEKQRIASIRAMQQPFDFLLLDEPFSHLDETNRAKCVELMEKEARSRGAAIILADLKPIEYFSADRVLHL